MKEETARARLNFLLWIFVLHTLGVAIGLLVLPSEYLIYFGFQNYHGRFFQMQAGVFHLVMAVAYLLALYQGENAPGLIYFAVLAKSIAVFFLAFYYLFVEQIWMILLSALGDGFFGMLLLILYNQFLQSREKTVLGEL